MAGVWRAGQLSILLLAACGGSGTPFSIPFAATVAGAPFSCTQTYANIGTSKTTIAPQDLRMYISGVALTDASGATTALTLDENENQHDDIALLDFEDGTGTCMTESPAVYTTLVGKAPPGAYTGVTFTVGVPQSHDHLDVISATAPLNQPAMFWSWVGGYKYAKIEVGSTKNATWFFHLGAQTCSAASDESVVCKYPNLANVALSGWSASSIVTFDLAQLYATSNLDAQVDGVTDTVPGCMSFDGDPECPPLFATLGMQFEGQGAATTQTVFTLK